MAVTQSTQSAPQVGPQSVTQSTPMPQSTAHHLPPHPSSSETEYRIVLEVHGLQQPTSEITGKLYSFLLTTLEDSN